MPEDMAKCLKNNKNCVPNLQEFAKNGYICCGFNKKPKKYRHDVIKLCLQGKYVKNFSLEMTPSEALTIASHITATLSNITHS